MSLSFRCAAMLERGSVSECVGINYYFAHAQQVVLKYESAEAPMEVWKCVRKGRMGWPFSATVIFRTELQLFQAHRGT